MDIDARLSQDGMTIADLDDFTKSLIDRTLTIQHKIEAEEEEAKNKDEEYIPNVRLHNKLDDNIELIESNIQKCKIKKDKSEAEAKAKEEEEAKAETPKAEEVKEEKVETKEPEKVAEATTKSSDNFKIGWWDWD